MRHIHVTTYFVNGKVPARGCVSPTEAWFFLDCTDSRKIMVYEGKWGGEVGVGTEIESVTRQEGQQEEGDRVSGRQ